MLAIIFQNVSADYDTGDDMDIIIDSFSNRNIVWREEVNGIYQVFFGYEIIDTIYDENTLTLINETIDSNLNFDDGYMIIQNCEINGNLKITRAQVIIENCEINGNLKHTFGSINIESSNINGNVDIKNSDVGLRISNVNGNVKVKKNTENSFMTIVTGNNISGNVDLKSGICYVVGNSINSNLRIKEPAMIHEVSDNDVNGNTMLTDNIRGFEGIQITNSTYDVLYPQISIDPISNISYISWITEEGNNEIWYCGSNDKVDWSDTMLGGLLPPIEGHPNLDMIAQNYTLLITWKDGGLLTIMPDLDGDFVSDNEDDFPLKYSAIIGSFEADVVVVDWSIGISVAVDWDNNSDIEPAITLISQMPQTIPSSVAPYINITLPESDGFTVLVLYKYDRGNLNPYTNEEYLRIYAYHDEWRMIGDVKGQTGGVDLEKGYVWAMATSLSIFTIADSSSTDLNNNRVQDIWDSKNILSSSDDEERITIYPEDSTDVDIYISSDNKYHLVWVDERDGAPAIYYKQSDDYGKSWTTDTKITIPCTDISSMAFSGDDEHLAIAYVISHTIGLSFNSVICIIESFDAGQTWGLDTFLGHGQNPSLSVYGTETYVVFEKIEPDFFTYQDGLAMGRFIDGMLVDLDLIIAMECPGQHFVPKISIENNEIHIVWAGYFDGSSNNLYHISKELTDVNWNSMEYDVVTAYYGENTYNAFDIATENGALYIAWSDNRNGEYDIYAKWKLLSSSTWSDDIRLTSSSLPSVSPNLFVESTGVINMAWQEGIDQSSVICQMSFDITHTTIDQILSGESTQYGVVTGTYVDTNTANNVYEEVTEISRVKTFVATSETLHSGILKSGTFIDTQNKDYIYESIQSTIENIGGINYYCVSNDWTVPIDSTTQPCTLTINSGQLFSIRFFEFRYSIDDGATFISLGYTTGSYSIYVYSLPIAPLGRYIINANYMVSGPPNIIRVDSIQISYPTTTKQMEHTWLMDLSVGDATMNTFSLKGYKSSPGVDDSILFSYSFDDVNYIDMFTLSKDLDDGNYMEYSLPPVLGSTIFIRATDTLRVVGENTDTLYVDHMFIKSEFDEKGSITPKTQISPTGSYYAMNPVISLNPRGYWIIAWEDSASGSSEILLDSSDPNHLAISPIIEKIQSLDNGIISTDSDFTLNSGIDISNFHKNNAIRQLESLEIMLSAEDNSASYNIIESEIKPYIYSIILDETEKDEIINQLSAISDPLEPLIESKVPQPPNAPGSLQVNSFGVGGTLGISWGISSRATKYELYRTTLPLTSPVLWFSYLGTTYIELACFSSGNSYINSALTDGVRYYYGVRAYNRGGYSEFSCTRDSSGIPNGPPHIISSSPTGSSVPTGASISITFSEAMVDSNENDFDISPSVSGGKCSWSGNTMTWTHTEAFSWSTSYTVTILGTAMASTNDGNPSTFDATLDSNRDHLGEGSPTDDYILSFISMGDPASPPRVISTTPLGNDISISRPITVTFSEAMDKTTTQQAFGLNGFYSGTHLSSEFSYSWSTSDKILTATPNSALSSADLYTVTILGSAKAATSTKTLDGNKNGNSDGVPADNWVGCDVDPDQGFFRTPLAVDAPSITATSNEYFLSWTPISNPSKSYEIYYCSDNSNFKLLDSTSNTNYVMDVIGNKLEPHVTYYFKIRAFNTAGCEGLSSATGRECGRVDYYLDVGTTSNVGGENDLPSQPCFMPPYGLTLPPASTGLAKGWGPVSGSDKTKWREENIFDFSNTKQQFYFNLGTGPELHIDYLLTLRFRASGSFDLEQKTDVTTWDPVVTILGHYQWETISFIINHNNYFDDQLGVNWYGTNVLFRFSVPKVIHVDWIRAEPIAYYADVSDSDYTSTDYINTHCPGVCLYPGDWGSWDSMNGRLGNAGSRFIINVPELNQMAIKITYKPKVTGVDGRIKQFDGTNFIEIGALKTTNQDFYTGVFDMEPDPSNYYDSDTNNDYFNILFEMDIDIYIKSISIYSDVSEAHKSISNWVGYYLPTSLSSIQSELETHATNMGIYADIDTEVTVGDWATPEDLKSELKIEYNHGMAGAVLVGNMPMANFRGSISSLYYEDMGGGPGPEIFVGHLRPPTSKDDNAGMAIALKDYFVRATNFINGGWTSPNKALLIQSTDVGFDSTNLKIWLDESYSSYDYELQPDDGADEVLNDYILNPDISYDFCIMQAHSWYDNIVVYGNTAPPAGVESTIYSNDIISNSLNTPFYYFTCCRTTAFVDSDGNDNVDVDGNYYIAGQFAFNSEGWGLGAFGYSSGAGGKTPGAEGLFDSLNKGKTIGESIIAWGEFWENNPSLPDHVDHQNLIFIGDPLLKA